MAVYGIHQRGRTAAVRRAASPKVKVTCRRCRRQSYKVYLPELMTNVFEPMEGADILGYCAPCRLRFGRRARRGDGGRLFVETERSTVSDRPEAVEWGPDVKDGGGDGP